MEFEIISTDQLPSAVFTKFVPESERDGYKHVRRLVDEWQSGTDRFDGPGEELFLARLNFEVVGVCGLNLDPYQNDKSVGRVRRLYVAPSYRRRGIGQELVGAVINSARRSFQILCARSTNPASNRLFEQLGFRQTTEFADTSHCLQLQESNTTRTQS